MKRTPLRTDPSAIHDWQERTRQAAIEKAKADMAKEAKPTETRRALGKTPRTRRLRPVNRERRDSEWKRAYGTTGRVEWVSVQRCLGCGWKGVRDLSPCENHHIQTGGMGRKADADKIIPLCKGCHIEWHQHGRRTFEEAHRMDADAAARDIEQAWKQRGDDV